jgi:rhodanese-related sulfurtransferase
VLAQTASDQRTELQIVDVRSPEEWAAGHIDGSRNIPLDDLIDRTGELAPDQAVVAVCRTGQRSSRAVDTLRSLGLEAEHVEGGVTAWSDLDLPLVTADGGPGVVLPPGGTVGHHHDHDGHDHDGHDHHEHEHVHDEHCDHDHGSVELGGAAADRAMHLIAAVQEHFGEHEPTEEEARAFFEQLLASEGLSPEEIQTLLS